MGYQYFNPNPKNKLIGDCSIRAVSKALNLSWNDAYMAILMTGYELKDMPSSNHTWGTYLSRNGFEKHLIPSHVYNCQLNELEACYTVRDFCEDNPIGMFVVVTDGHVLAVENGDYYDTWDSGNEIPLYYWRREE